MSLIITNTEAPSYRIFGHLIEKHPFAEEIAHTDIGLLDLIKKSWVYDRGKKATRDYLDSDDNLVCQLRYTYTDDGSNHITDISKFIDFYLIDGTVGMTKDISQEYTPRELKKLNREIRHNQIDYLEAEGEENPDVEPILSAIFDHYEDNVDSYILRNGTSFADSIRVETDPTISAYLSIIVETAAERDDDMDLTIKGGILYQIAGVYV